MDQLETILQLVTDLQNDESIDLSEYATRFVDVAEASDALGASLAENGEVNETNEALIADLKSENWDLSKKITTKETLKEDDEVDVTVEEDESTDPEYETVDEAITDLFDEDKEKDEDK